MCQQLSAGLRALVEEPVAAAEPVAAPDLPHPDAWLGRVARVPGLATTSPGQAPTGPGQAGRAPALAQAGRAQSYAGRAASTNPFLSPPDAAPAL